MLCFIGSEMKFPFDYKTMFVVFSLNYTWQALNYVSVNIQNKTLYNISHSVLKIKLFLKKWRGKKKASKTEEKKQKKNSENETQMI